MAKDFASELYFNRIARRQSCAVLQKELSVRQKTLSVYFAVSYDLVGDAINGGFEDQRDGARRSEEGLFFFFERVGTRVEENLRRMMMSQCGTKTRRV